MSAFIVEDKTINAVVTYLFFDRDSDYARRKLQGLDYDVTTSEGREKLGRAMFSLNIRAVNQRYNDHPADQFRPLNYRFRLDGNLPKIAVLKALRCWLYQCTEGDCDKTELYRIMKTIANSWAYDIVSSLPAYEKAQTWH